MRWWQWAAVVLVTDQVSKWYFPIVVSNQGSAFGMGESGYLKGITVAVLCFLGWLMLRSDKGERLGLGLILAGGLSNFIDRVYFGAVRDFIYWPVLRVYGNVADVWLAIGVMVILWSYLGKKA